MTKPTNKLGIRHDHATLQQSFEETLNTWRQSGEEPFEAKLAKAAGVDNSYLTLTAKTHKWAKKIHSDYKKLRHDWEKHGGSEYKKFKNILEIMIENGERPRKTVICERGGRSSTFLPSAAKFKRCFPWQIKLIQEIEESEKAFIKPKLEIPSGYVRLTHQCQSLNALVKQLEWGDADVITYKKAAVEFGRSEINFGSWLYSRWLRIGEGKKGIATYVDPSSFDIRRTFLVKGAVLALNAVPESTHSRHARSMEKYVNWLNRTEKKVPDNVEQAKVSYRDFTAYLEQVAKGHDPRKTNNIIDTDNFGRSSTGPIQLATLLMLSEIFTNGNLAKIRGMTGYLDSRLPVVDEDKSDIDIDALNNALSYYYQFFEQVTDFLFEKRPYPHSITLLEHDALLIPHPIASYPFILTPFNGNTKGFNWRKYFDPNTLKLRNEAEAKAWVMQTESYQRTYHAAQETILNRIVNTLNTFSTAINEANHDHSNSSRLAHGLLAMQAYFMVLLDVTGLNDSTLATMPWSNKDDLFDEQTTDNIKLKNIKHRAGNKLVEFPIQRTFIKSFRTFLKLRRFILNGHNCDTLFFIGQGKDIRLASGYKSGNYGSITCRVFQKYYPDLKFFGSQDLRLFKKQWIMKQTNGRVYLAAKLLQHTESVSQSNYPAQSKEESQNMMGNYFDYQHSIIMEVEQNELTGSGACRSHNQPEAQVEEAPIKPDCTKKMTCLFCKHYRLKPLKQEIHKVLSMKYVIKEFSKLHAWSQSHFDDVTKPILERIELLLEAMKTKYPETSELIEDIRKEVNKQNLTSYWQAIHERNWEATW